MHGDLKSANILIADGFVAKIADFGLSRAIRKHQSDQTMTVIGPGTLRWMSPEALDRYTQQLEPARPTSATDIWAWGHLVYEIGASSQTITGRIPYYQYKTDFLVVPAIMKGEHNPRPTSGDESNADLFLTKLFWPTLEECWTIEPRRRPRITEIIRAGPFEGMSAGQKENSLCLHEDPSRFEAARRYKKQGETAYRQGKFQEALDYYHKARQIFDRISDQGRHADCLRDLGWTNIPLRNYDEARTCIVQAHDILVKIGDIKGQLGTMQDQAIIERAAGHPMLARSLLEDAYKGCRDAGLYIRSGWCLVATGLLDVDDKDWEAAHNRFDAAVDIAVREGDQGLLGRSWERKGDCYRCQDLRAQARRCYDDSARAYRNLPGQEYQVERVEEKIQLCHNIRHVDIDAMPLWNYRIMNDDPSSASDSLTG
ncbi:Tyrosine kinase domain protein [Ceratobasidium sp. AG-Ba]|nr:Tyrosine kinase domain protein [Ceratobasidium sp. AG-Ba]QRW13630.1 Tyrosine kinase domain protein [Ceratobasidium sp. AG-Ba]